MIYLLAKQNTSPGHTPRRWETLLLSVSEDITKKTNRAAADVLTVSGP
jgi:hypothetical protein